MRVQSSLTFLLPSKFNWVNYDATSQQGMVTCVMPVSISSSDIQQTLEVSASNFFMWSFSKSGKDSYVAQCQCNTVLMRIPKILQRQKEFRGFVFACICVLTSLRLRVTFPFVSTRKSSKLLYNVIICYSYSAISSPPSSTYASPPPSHPSPLSSSVNHYI